MKKNELEKLAPAELLPAAIALSETVEAQEKEIAQLKSQLEKAAKEYAELSKKLDQAETGAAPKTFGEVKVGKETYEIIRPKVLFRQTTYTADEIIENKEVAEALVKIGASALRKKEA